MSLAWPAVWLHQEISTAVVDFRTCGFLFLFFSSNAAFSVAMALWALQLFYLSFSHILVCFLFLQAIRSWDGEGSGLSRAKQRWAFNWQNWNLTCLQRADFGYPLLVSVAFCSSKSYIVLFLAETRVQIQESVRGKDVFIIQTVSKWVPV